MEEIRQLPLPLCDLGEGPLWHRETGEFVFTDITAGTLWAWSAEGSEAPRRLLRCGAQLGAFLFAEDGSLVLFTEKGVFSCPYGGTEADWRLLWQVPMAAGERFNDAICDPAGHMLAGTKTEENREGTLWLFSAGAAPRPLLRHLQISNGMGFSADGAWLYHTDSGQKIIRRYAYPPAADGLAEPVRAVQFLPEDPAVPDGMTVDAQGMLWTACWGGCCLRRFDPADGRLLAEFPMPGSQVSSLTFGGRDGRTVLVTSAACGAAPPPSGGIWVFRAPTAGREEYRAAVGPAVR